jgi:hypothetical protein
MQLYLIEPVDILFHCTDLCMKRSNKIMAQMQNQNLAQSQHQNIHLSSLKEIIHSILKTYLNHEPKYLFQIYKIQTLNHEKSTPIKLMIALHQLELGNNISNTYNI